MPSKPTCRVCIATQSDAIRNGVDAVRDLRVEEIVDLLNELEDLELQAREQAASCAEVEVTTEPTASASQS